MKTGLEIIVEERIEQIENHGYDADHDDKHVNGEMLKLALYFITGDEDFYPYGWVTPIKAEVFKKDRINQLAIAGAMIAAEIDRLQRKGEIKFVDLNPKK